jgi:4-amino-4-deoxy-L-arabinose transferase-like glycosyltransferase
LNSVQPLTPTRPRSTLAAILLPWLAFYASVALFTPPLLDDADSVHAEVAREMLLRHDLVTLHANGVRYLEKAPLFYWSMALSMKLATLLGATAPRALAAAARIPLALAVLALVLVIESLARQMFGSARAGLYAALILLSSFGIFLFTRMLIPDALVCLWITLAMYALWLTETRNAHQRLPSYLFAMACALNVLTKGLIGVVFPVAIAAIYLLVTRGWRGTRGRLRELHPISSTTVFLLLAAPWHILAGLANPTQGHPAPFRFVNGHWLVPLPSDGNVRGWTWFYFINEHLLRYLNLRVPHDYDTVPLWLFWGLCLLWLMPWSAFVFKAVARALPMREPIWRSQLRRYDLPLPQRGLLLLTIWAAFVLLFFSLSSRQEYYVLPALPALAILIAGWLAHRAPTAMDAEAHRRAVRQCLIVPLALGTLVMAFCVFALLHGHTLAPNTDLATLLRQQPADYALSLGHAMDITGPIHILDGRSSNLWYGSFFPDAPIFETPATLAAKWPAPAHLPLAVPDRPAQPVPTPPRPGLHSRKIRRQGDRQQPAQPLSCILRRPSLLLYLPPLLSTLYSLPLPLCPATPTNSARSRSSLSSTTTS